MVFLQILSAFRTNFSHYIRSQALLLVALATPIAAHFMVPVGDADYSVILVNGAAPILTPAVLGLELGIITAVIMTPLAYIFLRAGPARHHPWQITDVAPHSRVAMSIGRWLADAACLMIILTALMFAGFVLTVIRSTADTNGVAGLGWLNSFSVMAVCLWLTAGPALIITAAIKTMFEARPLLRKWPGDVLFFFVWMMILVVPIIVSVNPDGSFDASPYHDPFGMLYPVIQSTDVELMDMAIGGGPPTTKEISLDAAKGVINNPFIVSRLFWLCAAGILAIFAGIVHRPYLESSRKQGVSPIALGINASKLQPGAIPLQAYESVHKARRSVLPFVSLVISEVRLILNNRLFLILLVGASIAGAFFPYRPMVGPALFLLLIFPFSAEAARWRGGNMPGFSLTTGTANSTQFVGFIFAAMVVAAIAHLPALITGTLTGQMLILSQAAPIIFGVPLFAAFSGYLSRSAIAGRLILLIIWYSYFSTASVG